MSERSRAVRKSFYGRLAVAGFALIFVSIIVAGLAGNTTGAFSFAPPALIALIMALLIGVTGRGVIAAFVVSVLAVFLLAIGEVVSGLPALGHPESFADFVPALLRAVGSLMAFTGTLVAWRQARRATTALRGGSRAEKRLVKVGGVGVVALAALAGVLTYTRNAEIDAPPGAIVVENEGDEFFPTTVQLDEGSNQVLVVNRDSYSHTFTVDELDLDVYIGPRGDRLFTVDVPDDSDRLELYCAVSGHEDMTGTIEVSS